MRDDQDLRRIAIVSLHTSPLDQPGTGDAGGMNVYVVQTAKRLAERGVESEIFTRAVCRDIPPVVDLAPGVTVRSLQAGPFAELDKNELPAQICPFTFGLLRTEAARAPGYYDLLHAHYWLSGHVGVTAAERWGVPLIQSMHTLAKVKNLTLADGDAPEPAARVRGEAEVISAADHLVANTSEEARQLTGLYGAAPQRVSVVSPGVDLAVFHPGSPGGPPAARRRLGVPQDAFVVLFAGRMQPLKGPDIVLRAVAAMANPRVRVVFVGGPSGCEVSTPGRLAALAGELGIASQVRLEPPCPHAELAEWYRAASVVMVPSRSESFGLVAAEAQACGTPVVAAAVGGLRTTVRDGVSGVLVTGHDPADYARVLTRLAAEPARLDALSRGATAHAARLSWDATADGLLGVYTRAVDPRHKAATVSA